MRTYDEYWARQAAPTQDNSSYDDLQREKRLNNWQRSYQLPSMIGDAVQSAMLNNPYDRSAALRAELAQKTANSVNLPWRTKEALAAKLFEASPINATSGDGAAPGQRTLPSNPRTATQSAGPVAARGNINGVDLMVPTAGNYLNGAYQSQMQTLGLGESPSVGAYDQAVASYKSPQQKQQEATQELLYRRYIDAAKIQADGRVNAASAKPQKAGKDDTMTQLRKLQGMDDKERVDSTKELYGSYQKYVQAQQKAMTEPLPFDKWSATDPGAQAVQAKWQAIGEASGRNHREASAVKDSFDMAAQIAGIGIDAAGGLAKVPQDNSQERQAVSRKVAELKAQNMSPEQILAYAKQSGADETGLAMIQQELEGKKIRKAQYGAPAKPKSKSPAKPKAKQRPMFEGDYSLKAGPPVDY